jgi:hypothetical protein
VTHDRSIPPAAMRSGLVDYLRRELFGPDAEDEVLLDSPCKRYSAGVLFPRVRRRDEENVVADDDQEQGADADTAASAPLGVDDSDDPRASADASEDDDGYDEPVLLANTYYPAAVGISCLIDDAPRAFRLEVQAAVYETVDEGEGRRRRWLRRQLRLEPVKFQITNAPRTSEDRVIADGLAVRAVSRRLPEGRRVLTISLYNCHPAREADRPPAATECFFQTAFVVRASEGGAAFREYDLRSGGRSDPEELSLELLYRRRRQYAIGHGCAPEWRDEVESRVSEVRTECVPVVKVPPIEPTSRGGAALEMYRLAGLDGSPYSEVIEELRQLGASYERWIQERRSNLPALPDALRAVGEQHLSECATALQRILSGVSLLQEDGKVLEAFKLANRAVLMQQVHSKLPRRDHDGRWNDLPVDYRPIRPGVGRWRTFQLAFVLMNLASFVDDGAPPNEVHPRDIVDLIWFPTGGGKTEAYLGLTAFAIFLRRLVRPSNGGCVVLMRYTLRLLTAQQFSRAAALICACETIRAADPRRLGQERITLGLWVGGTATPNKRREAIDSLNRLAGARRSAEHRPENKFQVLTCPWCATAMDRRNALGYRVKDGTVVFICPDPRCTFSRGNPLPVSVIDEDIYDRPPSLVIGTVDKFAMLAWRQDAKSLFGLGRPDVDPPALVIQDELHLISGPLGSMVGLYEAAIEYLCTKDGRRPKIVASTATIRRAREQCAALYDRPTFQFPPPGLDITDSFFAEEKPASDGRLYVGVFASASPSPVTALVRTAAALHQGAYFVPLPEGAADSSRDPYWTQVQYFGSLRELGRAATLVEQDIPEYLKVIQRRGGISSKLMRWRVGRPVELTSRLGADEIPEILERLSVRYRPEIKGEERPIDMLLATNMISVGVDVPRLGLMIVVGQPKSTSEYIQASSRVGRSGDAPGLVVALYNPGKPRDRSHYEQFRSYHEAFYRHVEPTSVTPFSIPVLERALHAVLVIVARHVCGLRKPRDLRAGDPRVDAFLKFIRRRAERIDAEHASEVATRLTARLDEWLRSRPDDFGGWHEGTESRLMYPAGGRRPADEDSPCWKTPSSMRNVDAECEARVYQPPAREEA